MHLNRASHPSQRVQNCEHRPPSRGDSASRRESRAGWNFRKRTGVGTGSGVHPRFSLTRCTNTPRRATDSFPLFLRPGGVHLVTRVPWGTGFLVMPSPTRSYISAVTLLLQCSSGNAVLAQEGQATTATASANDRGDACAQSIEKVINLCMMRGLNNIGRVNCDCVQDGRKWTCTGAATCAK